MGHKVCRKHLENHLGNALSTGNAPTTANAGLLLRRGMTQYDAAVEHDEGGKGGTEKQKLIERIAEIRLSRLYQSAFKRWKAATDDGMRFTAFEAALLGRLYIGVARESALETGLTVHHAYGMPLIPGSALKGLARAVARTQLVGRADAIAWLFGADTEDESAQEAGGIIFHDAWWVPDGKPFVEEVVTPHHRDYYALGKAHATDFDSPVPAPQIAVQGKFLFVLEGDPAWCSVARTLLQHGLGKRGIGGKTSSGYGYFDVSASVT